MSRTLRCDLPEALPKAIEVYRSIFNDPDCNQLKSFHENVARSAEKALASGEPFSMRWAFIEVLRESMHCETGRLTKLHGYKRANVEAAKVEAARKHGMTLKAFKADIARWPG